MKKLICTILLLTLAISLCACGQENPSKPESHTTAGNTPTGTTGSIPTTGSVPTTAVPPTTQSQQPPTIASISEFTFTVYGKEFHLGMKMSDLLDSGLFTDVEYYEESLEPIASGGAFLNLGTDKKCTLTI